MDSFQIKLHTLLGKVDAFEIELNIIEKIRKANVFQIKLEPLRQLREDNFCPREI